MSCRYDYQPLKEGEIRLLKLHHNQDLLMGSMRHYQMDHSAEQLPDAFDRDPPESKALPSYMALSHHWDPKPETGTTLNVLLVQNEASNQVTEIPLRPNLFAALEAIRTQMRNITEWQCHLWIDAVCIDQKSEQDKDMQLGRMGDIYNEAKAVIVWLGELDDDTSRGLTFVKNLQNLEVLRKSLDEHHTHIYREDWKCLGLLTRKPWFQRLWIVQEIAAAREAIILAGNRSRNECVPWDHFAAALSLFVSQFDKVRTVLAKSGFFAQERDPFGDVHLSGANVLVEMRGALLRKKADGEIAEHLKSLEALLTSLSMFEVSEPHDIVYAILWLSNDATQGMKRAYRMSHMNTRKTPSPSPPSSPSPSPSSLPMIANSGSRADALQRPSAAIHVMVPNGKDSDAKKRKWSGAFLSPTDASAIRVATSRRQSISHSFHDMPAIVAEQQQADHQDVIKDTGIIIDYKQTVFELCVQVLHYIIKTTESLDIICYHWAPPPQEADIDANPPRLRDEEKHPSWLLYTQRNTYEHITSISNKPLRRVNADPLIGKPGSRRRPYLACGRTRAKKVKIEGRVLHAYGYPLAAVAEDAGVALNAVVPVEWRQMLGWTNNNTDPPDCFWRTMVADKGPENFLPPARFKLACKWAFTLGGRDVSLPEVRNDGDGEPPLKEFLDCAIATVWNRKLFRTETCRSGHAGTSATSFVGLGPKSVQRGDIVCILWGCAVPVLLRPMARARDCASSTSTTPLVVTESPTGRILPSSDVEGFDYTFIGECYVDGMMNGEIFHWADQHPESKIRDFDIH